jgi:hypothetical protein
MVIAVTSHCRKALMADDGRRTARETWLFQVLGFAASKGPRGGIAYRKLLLQWRDAQAQLARNLATLGDTLLGMPEVKADPRFPLVQAAVATLPRLVPEFNGVLEDTLDAGLNAPNGAQAANLARDGIKAVDAYRQQLSAVPHLLNLDAFATRELGQSLALHQALDDALVSLKQELSRQL